MRRTLFERIRRGVVARDPFFNQKLDCAGLSGASSYQKVTAALRMLAYAPSADQLDEYVRLAESTILKTTERFCLAVILEFGPSYLRPPNEEDLKLILSLSEEQGFNGCLGSVDVMKWEWKNCPMAWRGCYTSGKENFSTIGLEAIADCRLYFWHAYFGVPGSQNDINVIDQSDLFQNLTEGQAPQVKFIVNNKVYDMGYFLSDGIYPPWYCLMQTIPKPQGNKQKLLPNYKKPSVRRSNALLASSRYVRLLCLFFSFSDCCVAHIILLFVLFLF